jgi:Anaerobic dehydrogenases, typically selenocysteine-containing
MRKLSGGCTLDCFDACKFNVYTENNKIIKIEGDKNHPYTKGFICHKGLKHMDRHTHPLRQYKPLLKVDNKWEEISFDKALDIIAEKLSFYKENHGVNSLMYYEQYGSGSLLKSIGEIFFNFFGGSCKQKGGLVGVEECTHREETLETVRATA